MSIKLDVLDTSTSSPIRLNNVVVKTMMYGGSLLTNSISSVSDAKSEAEDASTVTADPRNIVQLWS